ncbi:MAG: hypothetical protein ACRECO_16845 [Xanthobacteraceae bacterium]
MTTRLCLSLCLLVLTASANALAQDFAQNLAQNKVRTETIRPPSPGQVEQRFKPAEPGAKPAEPAAKLGAQTAKVPDIVRDAAKLPPAVARTRERILAAARSGDLQKLYEVMKANEKLPIFSFAEDKNPVGFWKTNYPDSQGVEVLSILINVLEAAFVHVDVGTKEEIYLWPYFARMPLKSLTPEQKVELFRIVTGADYKDMVEFGAYSFYRIGIAPDGTWHFFVAGD